MSYLIVSLTPIQNVTKVNALPLAEFTWSSDNYSRTTVPDDLPVFYDWLRDDYGRLCGVECYILPEHRQWLGELCSIATGSEYGPVAAVWCKGCHVMPDGVQGFGNIWFYESIDKKWLLVVGSEWLRKSDSEYL
jgi:hypothetical protein